MTSDIQPSLKWRISHRWEKVRPRLRLGNRLAWAPQRLSEAILRRELIPLDLPPASSTQPRWGYDRPPHPGLSELVERREDEYTQSLRTIAHYMDDLKVIQSYDDGSLEPYWRNMMCPPLDVASIYAFIRSRNPSRYVEVGSGNSTRFAARAVRDGNLSTEIISIDPKPRIDVDALCTEVIRAPLEDYDLSVFKALGPDDIVFFDCSHRSFTNSDVTVFFLEILPMLPPGVLVGVHDIFLPDDYPPNWWDRYYSEQYLLSAWLLANPDRLKPVLACHYVSGNHDLGRELEMLWGQPNLEDAVADAREVHAGELGLAFWMECGAASWTPSAAKVEVA